MKLLQILGKTALSLGLGYLAYFVMVRGIGDWHFRYQPAPEGIRKALEWDQRDPEYYAALARSFQRSVGEGNPEEIVKLYEKWETAEPGTGRAEKAVEWRTRLEQTPK